MIQQVHPYMKLAKLPVGGQYAQKGQVVDIPMQCEDIYNLLPSLPDKHFQVLVGSKGFSYVIDIENIYKALQRLVAHNTLYKDVHIQQITSCLATNETVPITTNSDANEQMEEVSLVSNDYTLPHETDKFKKGQLPKVKLPFLTKNPVKIFLESKTEELAFPNLFPFGINGYSKVSELVTLKQYFNCRLLNRDARWANYLQYLFWALNIYEQNVLQSAISVAVRIGKTENSLKAHHILNESYKHQVAEDYRFMKKIKGTCAYWRNQLQDLMAKIQMLGPPTFFLSLSCKDSNWINLYQFIDTSLSESEIDKLTLTQKRNIVRNNPVKCALYFSKR